MDARKVGQRGSSQYRVSFANQRRHERIDNAAGGASCGNGRWRQQSAVTMMENMALAKINHVVGVQGCAGVEKAVCDVNCPGRQG